MSILAFDPPVLTTEITCVALPTEFANHGAPAAPLPGASTSDRQIAHATAHSRVNSRRMASIVRGNEPEGQVKLQTRLGHRVVINENLRRPKRQQAQQEKQVSQRPAGQHVGRVMHVQSHPGDPDRQDADRAHRDRDTARRPAWSTVSGGWPGSWPRSSQVRSAAHRQVVPAPPAHCAAPVRPPRLACQPTAAHPHRVPDRNVVRPVQQRPIDAVEPAPVLAEANPHGHVDHTREGCAGPLAGHD